ncbi:bifunctional DNA primase/polymerase [Streptacidiphilus sp. PAMC 29251]
MTPNEFLLSAALAAAWHGWPVFPLRPGTKRPALHGADHCPGTEPCTTGHRKWEQRATLDPELIRSTWQRAPYNIGVATGPAGLLVVDLDKPKGNSSADMPDGMTTFKALCERAGHEVPITRRVRTAGGGWHLYFTAPTGARLGNTAGTLAPLVDTRGWGGYVVGAGSIVNDQPYDMNHLLDPAPLPRWLLQALTPAPAPRRHAVLPSSRSGSGYADAALRNETLNVARSPEGTRNAALTRAARALGRFVATGTLARAAVEDALKAAGECAGLLPREIDPVITSALNWSIAHNSTRAA